MILARVAAGLLRLYKVSLSPLLPRACRFEPTCSEYARAAVLGHGVFTGGWLALRRLMRCHPFYAGGYDPPPPSQAASARGGAWKNERSRRRV